MYSANLKDQLFSAALPLKPLVAWCGSACSVTVAVPHAPALAGIEIGSVGVTLSLPDGSNVTAQAAHVANTPLWTATFPAANFAVAGTTAQGLMVTLAGKDEHGEVRTWIVAKGDLEVRDGDASPSPSGSWVAVKLRTAAPENPVEGDAYVADGILHIYAGGQWVGIGGGGLDDAVTPTGAKGVKSSGIWSAIWGALEALPSGFTSLYDWCVAQLGYPMTVPVLQPDGFCYLQHKHINRLTVVPAGFSPWIKEDDRFGDPVWDGSAWTVSPPDGFFLNTVDDGGDGESATYLVAYAQKTEEINVELVSWEYDPEGTPNSGNATFRTPWGGELTAAWDVVDVAGDGRTYQMTYNFVDSHGTTEDGDYFWSSSVHEEMTATSHPVVGAQMEISISVEPMCNFARTRVAQNCRSIGMALHDDGYGAFDCLLRLEVPQGADPIAFSVPEDASAVFETEDGEAFPAIEEGVNLYSFTQTAPHRVAVAKMMLGVPQ